jgi:hypothetical protein
MNIPDHIAELRNKFLDKKYLNSLIRNRNFLTLDPGWKNSGPG